MNTTLTIRNLDEGVKQKLRIRAARHNRSMEAEAREIIARNLQASEVNDVPRGKYAELVGLWKGRSTTDEMMKELRGDD